MFSKKQLKQARQRDGAKDEDRSEDVENLLTPNERLGWREGAELLDCPYSEYPQHDQVLRPAARDHLSELANHDLVTSIEDIGSELATDVSKVRRAFDLHDLEEPTETFDVEVTTDRLDGLADLPDRMIEADNPVLVGTLYVSKGLSTGEIREVIDEGTDDNVTIHERQIKQTLVDAKVIEGMTSAERDRQWQQSRGEVNRSGEGLSISTEDI